MTNGNTGNASIYTFLVIIVHCNTPTVLLWERDLNTSPLTHSATPLPYSRKDV